MANKINICFLCGGVASDRWKIRPNKYICDECYKKLFKSQEGSKKNADMGKNKQQ